jgi:CMP-N-acetylneuraminic acid synthetase
MPTIALIPARGGSKGLPNKNLLTVGGLSLVERAVKVALGVGGITEVVVSSDSTDILNAGASAGAQTHVRPGSLAGDDSIIEDVARILLAERPDVTSLVVLQPTSPLRAMEDVERCLAALDPAPAATTVTVAVHPPQWTMTLHETGAITPVTGWEGFVRQRHDASPTYHLNGVAFAASAAHILAGKRLVCEETVAVVTPAERSVDVDTKLDLDFARFLCEYQVAHASDN